MTWLDLKREIQFNIRYGIAGTINGLFSLSTIWYLTVIDVTPVFTNAMGFAVGIIISFIISRIYVFRSSGSVKAEATKFTTSFIISYLINITTLQICISFFFMKPIFAQGFAIGSYIIAMYLASRFYTFRRKDKLEI